jgi:hypothetical protein
MLAVFCLRLAAGMIACLLLLAPARINPRFFRTHFLTALGLALLAYLGVSESGGWSVLIPLALSVLLCFLGSLFWSLHQATGTRVWVELTTTALAITLAAHERAANETLPPARVLTGDATSAALLGAALTAMLMGHSYLIAPTMSLTPLLRLLAALAIAIVLRFAADGYALVSWTGGHSLGNLEGDNLLWLPLRWGMGFVLPLGLTGMAWRTARIRSTQSATGILYVVVIFCFLGELTSLLLRETGLTL